MQNRGTPPSARSCSVKEDWRAWLPEEKSIVFKKYVKQLETSYVMFSVSLDEALALRQAGYPAKAYQAISVTPALSSLLSIPLSALLRAVSEHAKHYGVVPNAAPFDSDNFQSVRGQRSTYLSNILSRILLTSRAQFLHKIGTLEELVEDLCRDFSCAVEELVEATSLDPGPLWQMADTSHYDLNTCLRESIVVLKSFLLAIPDAQLPIFQETVTT